MLDKEAKGGISGSRISNDLDSEQQKDDYRVRDRELKESECQELFSAEHQLQRLQLHGRERKDTLRS